MVTRYLLEQEIAIPEHVATSLFTASKPSCPAIRATPSGIDDTALQALYPLIDKDTIAKIKNAPLPETFFETLSSASSELVCLRQAAHQLDQRAAEPELCCAVRRIFDSPRRNSVGNLCRRHDSQLILCCDQCDAHAGGEFLRHVVQKIGGRAGGHDRRAGGFIPLSSTSPSAIEQVQSEFRRRMLKVLQIEETRGRRLVSRGEMMRNMV